MSRKIILNMAMSLDGYISDNTGGFDWIYGDGNRSLDTKDQWSYEKFVKEVDTVVMGHTCFEQKFSEAFSDKKIYVATESHKEDHDNIHFIQDNITKPILEEMKQDGKNIFLFGGGITIDPFIKANLVDEYVVGIIPIILGKGRTLFQKDNPRIRLYLDACYINSGITTLHYKKKI